MQCQFPQGVSATVLFASGRFGSRGLLLFWVVFGLVTPAGEGRADLNRAVDGAISLAAASLAQGAAGGGARTWTDNTGQYKIEAELVDCRDGTVRLKKTDGKIVSLPLSRLSAADRKFVEERTAKPSGTTPAKPDIASWAGKSAVIEFVSGAKSRGRIVTGNEKYISVEVAVGTRKYLRKYPLDRVHAVTIGAKREVLNEKTDGGRVPRPGGTTPQQGSGTNPAAAVGARRTSAQVNALVDKLGSTPPDWWESVPLDYPETLDLSWPQKPPPPWNPRKNVGQYNWDIIHPNPSKWQSGIRFMHHLLEVNKDKPQTRLRAMRDLGRMYHDLLQDYARAAFWWRRARVDRGDQTRAGVHLAECYWRLGNRQMAMELLKRLPPTFSMIKLWADMGETQYALRMAEANTRGSAADVALIYAGEACRVAGLHSKALEYYRRLLAMPATGQAAQRIKRNQQRARANVEAIRLFDMLDLRQVPDGTYRSNSPGYAGQIHVEVTVTSGRIESVKVTQHKEKQFYSALNDTTRKIIEKQSLKGIDATSSATITSEAIINATAKALSAGMK